MWFHHCSLWAVLVDAFCFMVWLSAPPQDSSGGAHKDYDVFDQTGSSNVRWVLFRGAMQMLNIWELRTCPQCQIVYVVLD